MEDNIIVEIPYNKYDIIRKDIDKNNMAIIHIKGINISNIKKPFFTITKDNYDKETVKSFIEAISNAGLEAAKVYLSKNLKAIGTLDLDELKKVFNNNIEYKYLSKVRFSNMPSNIVTNSILIMSDEVKKNSIIHLYMIKEPDIHGNWKICGIERE